MASECSFGSQSTPNGMRRIELTLTDLRESTWKNVPEEGRTQKNVKLKDVIITGCDHDSYKSLKLKISVKLAQQGKTSDAFDISNPDCARINEGNVGWLKNHDWIVLLDESQMRFPAGLVYKQTYSTVPHTNTVTKQEGKFYGTEEHNPAAFALAELVDNALAATKRNKGQRRIEIHYYEHGNNPSLHILDNGCGMNSEILRSSLKLKAPKESRRSLFSDSPPNPIPSDDEDFDLNENVHPMHINSNINKFGAGLKQAIFWLGEETLIMTKEVGTENVCEVPYSGKVMESKEQSENEDPWDVDQFTRSAGELRDTSVSPNIRTLIEQEEVGKPSFTHIVIQNLHKDGENPPIDLLRLKDKAGQKSPGIEKQLAHIYHYYLHGRSGIIGETNDDNNSTQIQISVHRHDVKGNVAEINLRDIPEQMLDLESKFVRTAAPDPFLFTISVAHLNRINGNPEFKVGGIIRYHPFLYDHETIPARFLARQQPHEGRETEYGAKVAQNGEPPPRSSRRSTSSAQVAEATDEDDSSQDVEAFYKSKDKEFFHIWWNGRLIPHTRLNPFDWCSPEDKMNISHKMYRSYGRISGSLFFDKNIPGITENKLNMTTTTKLTQMFNEKKIGAQQSTFHQIEVSNTGILKEAKRLTAKKRFVDWLTKCQGYDKQVFYSGLMSEDKIKINRHYYYQYRNADWEKFKLKVGSAVKLHDVGNTPSPRVLGRIKAFYVKCEHCRNPEGDRPLEKLHAPLSSFQIELEPSAYYGQCGLRVKAMSLIDRAISPKEADELIKRQMNELEEMTLVVKMPMEPELKDGSKVRIDETLVKIVAFDIVNKDKVSVNGFLPYYESKSLRKRISMFARIHRIRDNGTRHLYYTSRACGYWKKPDYGYWFEGLDLKDKEMFIKKPGSYVITFRSYIDHDLKQNNKNPGSPVVTQSSTRIGRSKPPPTPSLLPDIVVDPPYEEEWEQEVDSLGRKILMNKGQRIRMPYLEIKFSVVAGTPCKFNIHEFTEDSIRVGQPFNITVSFKDSKENPTALTECIMPTISVIPSKECPGFRPKVIMDKVKLQLLGDRLIIQDVVVTGYLVDMCGWQHCKVEVQMELEKKIHKQHQNTVLHSGSPVEIKISEESVEIENGSRAPLTCLVTDSSGNVLIQNEKKPILLDCQIYKRGDDGCEDLLCTKTILATSENNPKLTDELIKVEELKAGEQLTLPCKVSYAAYPNIKPASVLINIIPSTRPEKLLLFYQTATQQLLEIEAESELVQNIQAKLDLSFKLVDGMGKVVSYDKDKHKVKCSWLKKGTPSDSGTLPTIDISTRAKVRKELCTQLKILGHPEKYKHNFYLTTLPHEPFELKVFFAGGASQPHVPIDQPPPEIIAHVLDRFCNVLRNLSKEQLSTEVEISADDCTFQYETELRAGSSFVIKQLHISKEQGGGPPPLGEIMLTITFGEFRSELTLNMISGAPTGLIFELNGESQRRSRFTYALPNQSDVRVCARLIDEYQNVTEPIEDTMINFTLVREAEWVAQESHRINKVMLKSGGEGIADFGVIKVGVHPSTHPDPTCSEKNKRCPGKCFGKTKSIQAATTLLGKTISAICNFHITCRPNTPFNLVVMNRGSGIFRYEAGSTFNHLTVTLEQEDGSKFINAEKEHLVLVLTKSTDPNANLELPAKNVQDGVYTLDKVPTLAGLYKAKFVYNNNHNDLKIV